MVAVVRALVGALVALLLVPPLLALTHDPKIDDPALIAALKAECFYIGALGSKKTQASRAQRLKDAGADEILFMFQMGGIPHDVIMETIRNIGEKVIPHFRAQEAAIAAPAR